MLLAVLHGTIPAPYEILSYFSVLWNTLNRVRLALLTPPLAAWQRSLGAPGLCR